MTIRSHLAEVMRSGVIASLTGGYCYSPRDTLLCNTVHLYVWLILFVLPVVLGLSGGSALSWPLVVCYCTVVAGLFLLLKVSTFYLHGVFDTHEPIVAETLDEEPSRQSLGVEPVRSGMGSSDGGRADAIEMTTFARSDVAAALSTSAPGCLNIDETDMAADVPDTVVKTPSSQPQHSEGRSVLIAHNSDSSRDLAVAAVVHSQSAVAQDPSDEQPSPGSDQKLLTELLTDIHSQQKEEDQLSQVFEESDISLQLQRKYSEPTFYSATKRGGSSKELRKRRIRQSSGGSQRGVRRAQSSLETSARQTTSFSFALSQHTLEECRLKGTRKSFPCPTSSTDIFLLHERRSDHLKEDVADKSSSGDTSALNLAFTNQQSTDSPGHVNSTPVEPCSHASAQSN